MRRRGPGRPSCRFAALLELAGGVKEDDRHSEREIVFQVGADLLVCTLRLLPDALGVKVQVGLVVDFKVIR